MKEKKKHSGPRFHLNVPLQRAWLFLVWLSPLKRVGASFPHRGNKAARPSQRGGSILANFSRQATVKSPIRRPPRPPLLRSRLFSLKLESNATRTQQQNSADDDLADKQTVRRHFRRLWRYITQRPSQEELHMLGWNVSSPAGRVRGGGGGGGRTTQIKRLKPWLRCNWVAHALPM